MTKKSSIYNIAEEANNIQDDCYIKRSLANYHNSRNIHMRMSIFKQPSEIIDHISSFDELCYYIENTDNIRRYKKDEY